MAPPLFGRFQVVVLIASGRRARRLARRRAEECAAWVYYRRGGVSSIASVLSLPRTPTGGCNACRAVASHLLRGPLGAALQSSDATKRGRASALATMTLAVDCSGRSTAMYA